MCDARVPKTPPAIVQALLASLGELGHIAWRAAERPLLAYSPRTTYNVGDLIEHPKFGRGSVTAAVAQRIDVELPDGTHTLVYGK